MWLIVAQLPTKVEWRYAPLAPWDFSWSNKQNYFFFKYSCNVHGIWWFCFMVCIFTQNSFQIISVIFCFLVPDVLKIAFSTLDLLYNRIVLYNRIILYNRTISLLVLFMFTGVTFGVFDIIYFRLTLKALDLNRFSWWMCCKTEIRIKVLSLKSSNFSKFFPNPLKLCTCRET